MPKINTNFSKRLALVVLHEHGLKIGQFAKEMEIHINSATRYLKNGIVPEWPILMRICDKYNLHPYWLITGEGTKWLNESKKQEAQMAQNQNAEIHPDVTIGATAEVEVIRAKQTETGGPMNENDRIFFQDMIRDLTARIRAIEETIKKCTEDFRKLSERVEALEKPRPVQYGNIAETKKTPVLHEPEP